METTELITQLLELPHEWEVYKVKGKVTTMDRYHFGEFAALESIKYMDK